MAQLNPYLNFHGNTEEAFNFYKSVFGGEFLGLMRFKDTPEPARFPENEQNMLMHVALRVGSTVIMGTDTLDSMGQKLNQGNNISINYMADSEDEARDIFKKLSDCGKVSVPMEKQFWGDLFGMATDKFGIHWMVTQTPKGQQ